jgi:Plasmid pRiA4b ORF-3-like protein
MPEPPTNPEPVVYQLRVVLRGVSPLIWRRLLVRSDSTIADLHASLQLVLGWRDEHVNRFVIHGREYGVWHDGGIGFRDNPRHVCLANLGLRVRERFLYEYDFTDGWQHDVRLEQSCHSSQDGTTRSASAADAQRHPKTAARRGRSWNGTVKLRRVVSA